MVALAHDPVSNQIRSILEQKERGRILETIQGARIFQGLPSRGLEDIARRVAVKRVQGGKALLHQDESPDSIYLLMAGRVKLVMVGENGREVTLGILRSGDVIGEMGMFDGKARSASAVALEPVTALCLSREELMMHIREYPQTAMNFLGEISRRLRLADQTVAEMALCDVQERMVRRLVRLAKADNTVHEEGMILKRRPTQQDLANMVGSCRETISRTFNQFVKKGLLRVQGRSLLLTHEFVQLASPHKNHDA